MSNRYVTGFTLAAAAAALALGVIEALPEGKTEDDVTLALSLGVTDEEAVASLGITKSEARAAQKVSWSESVLVTADEAVAAEADAEIAATVCSFVGATERCLLEQSGSLRGPVCPDGERRVYVARFQATPKLAAALAGLKLSTVSAGAHTPAEECK